MQCSKLSLTNVIIIPIVKRIRSFHALYAKKCNKNQQSIQCSLCKNWVHHKCNGITKQLAMLPSFAVRSKLSKMSNLNDFDMDENFTYTINSKYYSLAEISKLNPVNELFTLFHLNIRSLSCMPIM